MSEGVVYGPYTHVLQPGCCADVHFLTAEYMATEPVCDRCERFAVPIERAVPVGDGWSFYSKRDGRWKFQEHPPAKSERPASVRRMEGGFLGVVVWTW